MRSVQLTVMVLIGLLSVFASCGGGETQETSSENPQADPDVDASGELAFVANGEDFITQGFQSRDGWNLEFDHVYVTLSEVTALQTSPPWDPDDCTEPEITLSQALGGTFTVDLVGSPVTVGSIEDAPAGHYNAISWKMTPALSGPSEGYTILLEGTALRYDPETDYDHVYQFRIGFEDCWSYTGGEYVGDVRKGLLEGGGSAEMEMTFHFDHLFGDGDLPESDPLNVMAPGFDLFAGFMQEGVVWVDQQILGRNLSTEDILLLEEILSTLGHVGEGHCHCEPI